MDGSKRRPNTPQIVGILLLVFLVGLFAFDTWKMNRSLSNSIQEQDVDSQQEQDSSNLTKGTMRGLLQNANVVVPPPFALPRQPLEKMKLTREQRSSLRLFKSLYADLLDIKNTEAFRKYGFSSAGPYSKWMRDVEQQMSDVLLEKGILFEDLQMLAFEYVSNDGLESEVTGDLNMGIFQALNPLRLDDQIAPSGKSNYEKIKGDYELFGKWMINNSVIPDASYTYEVFKKGQTYVGFLGENYEYTGEILERIGNYFIIKGNNPHSRSGEYYFIDEQKNLILFDQDGDLTKHGFSATRLQ